jgi:hypothetical protein
MLTDAQIRKAKAADKPYKLTDGGRIACVRHSNWREVVASPARVRAEGEVAFHRSLIHPSVLPTREKR